MRGTAALPAVVFGLFFAAAALGSEGNSGVAVVVGPGAPAIERFASEELCRYLGQLFDLQARPTLPEAASGNAFILVGSPDTNPVVRDADTRSFTDLSDQGIVLRRTQFRNRPALVVGGGSPRATLWAVYALLEHWGVRYLLHGDVLPPRSAFQIPTVNKRIEPILKVRQWRVVNEFAMGPASWGIAHYRPVIDQLAKLRFNRILVYLWPHQPFLDYEIHGIKRRSATIFFGQRFPITHDMIGRGLFRDTAEFWNPDLPVHAGYEELTAAGIRHVRAVMSYAKTRGMDSVLVVTPTEFPAEFAPLLREAQRVRQVGQLTVVPGPSSDVDDPALRHMAATILRSALDTYPDADYLALSMPEWRQWVSAFERAWTALDRKYRLRDIRTLDSVLEAARQRRGYSGGAARALNEVKGDIVALYFYDRLFAHEGLAGRIRDFNVKLIFDGLAEELFPLIDRLLPADAETLNFIDYTPTRILKRKNALRDAGAAKRPAVLIYTLHDDNVGVVPQLTTGSLYQITKELVRYGWAGYSTRYWLIGDHDLCVAYLSAASWGRDVTPEDIYRDRLERLCGAACVEPMLSAFRELESATIELETRGLNLGLPVPNMMTKHWLPESMIPGLPDIRQRYRLALDAVERAARLAGAGTGANYLRYWAGRLTFGVEYLDTIEALRLAAAAQKAGDLAATLRHADASLDHSRRAIDAYARVARDQSDRGAIAMLNEYAYRALKRKRDELRTATENKP